MPTNSDSGASSVERVRSMERIRSETMSAIRSNEDLSSLKSVVESAVERFKSAADLNGAVGSNDANFFLHNILSALRERFKCQVQLYNPLSDELKHPKWLIDAAESISHEKLHWDFGNIILTRLKDDVTYHNDPDYIAANIKELTMIARRLDPSMDIIAHNGKLDNRFTLRAKEEFAACPTAENAYDVIDFSEAGMQGLERAKHPVSNIAMFVMATMSYSEEPAYNQPERKMVEYNGEKYPVEFTP